MSRLVERIAVSMGSCLCHAKLDSAAEMDTAPTTVTDRKGVTGTFPEQPEATNPRDGEATWVAVRLSGDRHVHVPRHLLTEQRNGTYRLKGTFAAVGREAEHEAFDAESFPLTEEELQVRKEKKETGRVHIRKKVHEHTETIDEPLFREEVDVERVPVDRVVDEPPAIRREGETTILPVLEERLVVTKQLVLKEELHVTRHRTEHHDPQDVMLRREEAAIGRVDLETMPGDPPTKKDRP